MEAHKEAQNKLEIQSMNESIITQLCEHYFGHSPYSIVRCTVGQANYVYMVSFSQEKYTIRCSMEPAAYADTVYWLERLAEIQVPVPQVIAKGSFQGYEYLILSYLEGQDLGIVYPQLTKEEKRRIAVEIVQIQNRVATLQLEHVDADWSWQSFLRYMLDRAEKRIADNGYFDVERVERLRTLTKGLEAYFTNVQPLAYLDDISSKNLLIHNGQLSGIIDVDWMGIGDRLTFVALTYMALLNMEYDTDYVDYILKEMQVNDAQRKAFLFYSLMYCVDFMGERGMQFTDQKIAVNDEIVDRLNGIYDRLWTEWNRQFDPVIGKTVTVTVDRPLGSTHPVHKDLYYPINYGYVEGIMAPDGEEQDAYIVGVEEAVQQFTGKVIAIVHRYDDVEEKWVVAPDGLCFTREEIAALIDFQEQYFDSEIRMENGSGNE